MTSITLEHPDDGITLVTLNRPDKLNAMTAELVSELHGAARRGRSRPRRAGW